MLKTNWIQTSFTGTQRSLFTRVTSTEVLLALGAAGVAAGALVSTFVSICLGCLLLLFGACCSTEPFLFGLWLQDANRPLNGSVRPAAAAAAATDAAAEAACGLFVL